MDHFCGRLLAQLIYFTVDFWKAYEVGHNDTTGEAEIKEEDFRLDDEEKIASIKNITALTYQHYEEMRTFLKFYGPNPA